jgi:phosphoglycolate phosphatase/putative hydrolase of the HAD superfamily
MKIYALPEKALGKGLLFDFDSTLYTNPEYARFQNEVLIERLAKERRLSLETLRAQIDARRVADAAAGRGRTSLGNVFAGLGLPIETSVAWREELIEPSAWLEPDSELGAALGGLAARYSLALVTNNPRSVGLKGLEALGVASCFKAVVGLDDTMRSKPDPAPYLRAASALGLDPASCVSIGDRYDVDLAPALSLGMGAVLVDGVEDVYRLPELLL